MGEVPRAISRGGAAPVRSKIRIWLGWDRLSAIAIQRPSGEGAAGVVYSALPRSIVLPSAPVTFRRERFVGSETAMSKAVGDESHTWPCPFSSRAISRATTKPLLASSESANNPSADQSVVIAVAYLPSGEICADWGA